MHLVSQLVNAYVKIIISSFLSYFNENCVLTCIYNCCLCCYLTLSRWGFCYQRDYDDVHHKKNNILPSLI